MVERNLDSLIQNRARARRELIRLRELEIQKASEKILFHRLSGRQRASWRERRTFSERIHGRRYELRCDGRIFLDLNRREYEDVFALRGRLLPNGVERRTVSLATVGIGLPAADLALINLLMLRYTPRFLWKLACIDNTRPGESKDVEICLDKSCQCRL